MGEVEGEEDGVPDEVLWSWGKKDVSAGGEKCKNVINIQQLGFAGRHRPNY